MSCQNLRNNAGKDTKAFHCFINDNVHWSVNNLAKNEDYWVTLPVYPSITREQVSEWWIISPPCSLSHTILSPQGKNKQVIIQTSSCLPPILYVSSPCQYQLLTRRRTVWKIIYKRLKKWGMSLFILPSRILQFIKSLFKK